MITNVFFDLDGTLSDSFEGISNGVLYALEHLNIPAPPRDSLKSFVGPPLFDEFKRQFGLSDERSREAVRLYREYYPQKGIFEQRPISGAEQLLKTLKNMGVSLCLATSKPQEYAEKILKIFGFEKYFDNVIGASFDGKISAKADVIALALKTTRSDPETTLMVGDRSYDIEGAHACGVRCAGVLCGFGSFDELMNCGADYIAANLSDIEKLITDNCRKP